jgi:hypothetical protein
VSLSLNHILETQSALYRALRGSMANINETLLSEGLRLAEWPIERPGCVYTLSITLERISDGMEIGEARFTIDTRGAVHFDADDEPVAACAPSQSACESMLSSFAARRIAQDKARRAAA